jgi:6-phosphogluconolactonase (cycloisomerase 2 family)
MTTDPAAEAATAPDLEQIAVGGYTSEMGGSAAGLTLLTGHSAEAGRAEYSQLAPVELLSPSYVIKHPSEPWLYVVSESSPGSVSAISYDDHGAHLINTVASDGDGGCHLCFDHSGEFVVVAHYTSGSIASFAIEDNGALSERIGLLEFSGSGPDPYRQDRAHAHQVVSVGESIMVPDLGSDAIHLVSIDDDGELTPAGESIQLPAGLGPRHLVLSGRHLVVACELSATLWISALDAALSAEGTTVATSTASAPDRIYPSGIEILGDQIVVANRGANTISAFTLDAYGTAHPFIETDCGGEWPRDLTVSGGRLWVANQASDNISVFDPPAGSNRPGDWPVSHRIHTPSPACVVPGL